jgi:hypothetical protein
MDGLIEPSPLSEPSRESNWVPIGLGVVFVVIVVGIVAWFSRSQPKVAVPPPAYASSLALSDLKMSTAQNFVGSKVTYLDGTVSNQGNQTVTHVVVHVTFQDSMNQVAQLEDVPLHVLETSGPYPEAVDLSVSPLTPGQSKTFRLTFEHVSDSWNQAYPGLLVTEITTK